MNDGRCTCSGDPDTMSCDHCFERWSFPDPGHPIVDRAQHLTRYGKPFEAGRTEEERAALVLADTVSAIAYLIHTCPTTKLACEKLAAMRAAVRKLGPVAEEETAP